MAISQHELEAAAEEGQRFYDEHLKSILEPQHYGRYVAIDPRRGTYALADTGVHALDQVRAQGSDEQVYLVRVGLRYAEEML